MSNNRTSECGFNVKRNSRNNGNRSHSYAQAAHSNEAAEATQHEHDRPNMHPPPILAEFAVVSQAEGNTPSSDADRLMDWYLSPIEPNLISI